MGNWQEWNEDKILEEIICLADKSDRQLVDKMLLNLEIMSRWLFIKNLGLNLAAYFIQNHYQKIAIYGMAELGCRLLDELEGLGLHVSYGVDRRPMAVNARNRLPIIAPNERWEQDIDVMVVTPVFYYNEIEEMIHDKVKCSVVSLKEIIWRI